MIDLISADDREKLIDSYSKSLQSQIESCLRNWNLDKSDSFCKQVISFFNQIPGEVFLNLGNVKLFNSHRVCNNLDYAELISIRISFIDSNTELSEVLSLSFSQSKIFKRLKVRQNFPDRSEIILTSNYSVDLRIFLILAVFNSVVSIFSGSSWNFLGLLFLIHNKYKLKVK